jgi:hypothetical protein
MRTLLEEIFVSRHFQNALFGVVTAVAVLLSVRTANSWRAPSERSQTTASAVDKTGPEPVVAGHRGVSQAGAGIVQNAATYPGTDPGQRIAACIAALPVTGGTCDDRTDTAAAPAVSPMITSSTPPKTNVTILLPAATWTMTDSLVKTGGCWNGLSIIGEGEETAITTNSPRTLLGFSNCLSGMSQLHIAAISYNDTATRSSTLGFFAYIWNCSDCEVDHNWITNGGQGGIFIASSSPSIYSDRIHVHDNSVTSTYGSNIAFSTYTQNVEVDHNVCSHTHRNCIDTNGRLNNIHDNAVDTVTGTDASDRYGILVFQAPGLGLSDGNEIVNNTIRSTDFSCILVNVTDAGAGNHTKVQGNTCSNGDRSLRGYAGIAATSTKVGQSQDIEITGNTVVDAAGNGIEVDGFQNAKISGNVVTTAGRNCYQFNDSRSYQVTDNTCQDARSSGKGSFGGYLFYANGADLLFTRNVETHDRTSPSFGLKFQQTHGKMCGVASGSDNKIQSSVAGLDKCR